MTPPSRVPTTRRIKSSHCSAMRRLLPLRRPLASPRRRERRRYLGQEALELALLTPGGEAQRHVTDARVEVRAQPLGARLRPARHGPLLDELRRELGGVVGVEELLRLLERLSAILVDVDVVIERAAELRGVAALLAGHRRDAAPLPAELVGGELVRHPAVGVAGDPAERALDDRVGGGGAAAPREARRIGRDPDGARLLDRSRLERHALEPGEGGLVRDGLPPDAHPPPRDPLPPP